MSRVLPPLCPTQRTRAGGEVDIRYSEPRDITHAAAGPGCTRLILAGTVPR